MENKSYWDIFISFIPLITPILTGLFTLLSVIFGIKIGLSKFIKEKTFERKLDWFQKTIIALQEAKYSLQDLSLSLKDKPKNITKEIQARIDNSKQSLLKCESCFFEAELFAGQNAYSTILNFRHILKNGNSTEFQEFALKELKKLKTTQVKELNKVKEEIKLVKTSKTEVTKSNEIEDRLDKVQKEIEESEINLWENSIKDTLPVIDKIISELAIEFRKEMKMEK